MCLIKDDDVAFRWRVVPLFVVQGCIAHVLNAADVVTTKVLLELVFQLFVDSDVDDPQWLPISLWNLCSALTLFMVSFHALNGRTDDEGFPRPWLRCQEEHRFLLRMSFADHCGVIDLLVVDFYGEITIQHPTIELFACSLTDKLVYILDVEDGLIIRLR